MFGKITLLLILSAAVIFTIPAYSDWIVPETGTVGTVYDISPFQDKIFAASNPGGVFISINEGLQWIEVNNNIPSKLAQALTVLDNQVFVGTDSGIYATSDLGTKWIAKNNGLGNMVVYSLVTDGGNMYTITDDAGIFRSSNGGNEWFSMNNGDIIGMILYTVEVSNGVVYVGGQDGHIYTTTNNGTEWKDIRSGPLVFNVKSIAIDGNRILAGTSVGVFLSKNSGASWTSINSGLKNSDVTDVAFNGNLIYAATRGGGVFISNNEGSSWVPVNTGLPDMNVICLAFTNTYVFAGSQYASVCKRPLSEMVVPALTAPTLNSPVNNAENVNYETTFFWSEVIGTNSYSFELALSNDFSNPIIKKDNLQTTSVKQTLEKGLTYFWRVASVDTDGSKLWSEVWTFTTREDLSKPILYLPANQDPNVPVPTKFVWSATTGTVSYHLQIGTDLAFVNSLILNQVNITDTTFTYSQLKKDSSYFWQVGAVAADDSTLFSDVWSFKAGDTTTAIKYTRDPLLVDIYPNPVAGADMSVRFNFDANNAQVDIISLDGKSIGQLYSGDIIKGEVITVSDKISGVAPGVYFIRILSVSKNLIKEFIIK